MDVVNSYIDGVRYGRPGFAVFGAEGRLWVFRLGSDGLKEFLKSGEPAKSVTKIGVGPDGKTIRSVDGDVINAYLRSYGLDGSNPAPAPVAAAPAGKHGKAKSGFYSRHGFHVYEEDGRLWVFRKGDPAHDTFLKVGEPAKSVTKIGVGPSGKTVRSVDGETIDDYIVPDKYAVAGFEVYGEDGRIWVFRAGSDALKQYLSVGEPAKSVTKIGAGPDGKTIRAVDMSVIDAYMAAR